MAADAALLISLVAQMVAPAPITAGAANRHQQLL
jgi:hypothetical protein